MNKAKRLGSLFRQGMAFRCGFDYAIGNLGLALDSSDGETKWITIGATRGDRQRGIKGTKGIHIPINVKTGKVEYDPDKASPNGIVAKLDGKKPSEIKKTLKAENKKEQTQKNTESEDNFFDTGIKERFADIYMNISDWELEEALQNYNDALGTKLDKEQQKDVYHIVASHVRKTKFDEKLAKEAIDKLFSKEGYEENFESSDIEKSGASPSDIKKFGIAIAKQFAKEGIAHTKKVKKEKDFLEPLIEEFDSQDATVQEYQFAMYQYRNFQEAVSEAEKNGKSGADALKRGIDALIGKNGYKNLDEMNKFRVYLMANMYNDIVSKSGEGEPIDTRQFVLNADTKESIKESLIDTMDAYYDKEDADSVNIAGTMKHILPSQIKKYIDDGYPEWLVNDYANKVIDDYVKVKEVEKTANEKGEFNLESYEGRDWYLFNNGYKNPIFVGNDCVIGKEKPKPAGIATNGEIHFGDSSWDVEKSAHEWFPEDEAKQILTAVHSYTDNAFESINNVLRGGEYYGDSAYLKKMTERIRSVLQKARTSKPMRLYRGIDLNGVAPCIKDGKFSDDAFISTSSNEDKGFNKPVRLVIDVPAGYPALSVRSVSQWQSEDEVLLDAGATGTVTNVLKRDDGTIVYYITLDMK